MKVLRRVQRLDSIRLDSTYFTDEGYFVDHPILTSVGIFEYVNPDGSIRRELRLPEHVFEPESLKTYKGKPVIITHDAGIVDKNNVDEEQIGTIMSAGYRDGGDVRAEIIIHDTDSMKESGLKELSLGYNLDLIEEAGEWEGESYDAIQTNIRINHLALVDSARAGEQARLNIDSSSGATLKGGKAKMKKKGSKRVTSKKSNGSRYDNNLSPEEVAAAIAAYIASKGDAVADEEETVMDTNDIIEAVRENRDRRDSEGELNDLAEALEVIAQQDSDIDSLLGVIEQLQETEIASDSEENNDEDENEDSEEQEGEEEHQDDEDNQDEDENEQDGDESEDRSMNADAADKLVRERLAICRVGDKLNLDGLESKSLIAAKKAVIKKMFPEQRLDGKSKSYIQAMYDIAAEKAQNIRKNVNYQRAQMNNGKRMDSDEQAQSSASAARQRMIERREGGNE